MVDKKPTKKTTVKKVAVKKIPIKKTDIKKTTVKKISVKKKPIKKTDIQKTPTTTEKVKKPVVAKKVLQNTADDYSFIESLKKIENQPKIFTVLAIIIILLIPMTVLIPKLIQSDSVPVLSVNPSSNLVIWEAPFDSKVDKLYSPAISSNAPIKTYIEFNASKNDHEYQQIVISPYNRAIKTSNWWKGLEPLKFNVSDFTTEDQSKTLDSDYLQISKVEYMMDIFPDKLIPISTNGKEPIYDEMPSLLLTERRNYPLWMKIYVPNTASEGIYYSNLTIYTSSETISEMQIKLRVYNFTIPIERSTRSAVMPRSDSEQFLDNYHGHRIDINGPRIDYTVDEVTHLVTFDWTNWDTVTQSNIDKGAKSFDITESYNGHGAEPLFSTAFNITTISYYNQLQTHLNGKGWLGYAYIYIWDEPGENEYPIIHRLANLYKSAAPKLKILLTTMPHIDNLLIWDDIDIWVPLEHDVAGDMDMVRERQEAGDEVWYYVCLFPKAPYANMQAYSSLLETRMLGWQIYRWNLDGFLYWHTLAQYYGNYGMGYNGMLDGWLIYESETDSTNPYLNSTRWDILGDGLEDFETIVLLNDSISELKNINPQHNLVLKGTELLNHLDSLMPDFRFYSRNTNDYVQLRNLMRETIEATQIFLP